MRSSFAVYFDADDGDEQEAVVNWEDGQLDGDRTLIDTALAIPYVDWSDRAKAVDAVLLAAELLHGQEVRVVLS